MKCYTNDDKYTPEAIACNREFKELVRPFMEARINEGFSSHELSCMLMEQVQLVRIEIKHQI